MAVTDNDHLPEGRVLPFRIELSDFVPQGIAQIGGRGNNGGTTVVKEKPELELQLKNGVTSEGVDHFRPPGRVAEGAMDKDHRNKARLIGLGQVETIGNRLEFRTQKRTQTEIPDLRSLERVGHRCGGVGLERGAAVFNFQKIIVVGRVEFQGRGCRTRRQLDQVGVDAQKNGGGARPGGKGSPGLPSSRQ